MLQTKAPLCKGSWRRRRLRDCPAPNEVNPSEQPDGCPPPMCKGRLWSAHNSYTKIIDRVSIGAMEEDCSFIIQRLLRWKLVPCRGPYFLVLTRKYAKKQLRTFRTVLRLPRRPKGEANQLFQSTDCSVASPFGNPLQITRP